jgi:hypothetical protein
MLDRSQFLRVTAMIKLKKSHVVLSYNRALILPLLPFQVRFPDLVLWSQISEKHLPIFMVEEIAIWSAIPQLNCVSFTVGVECD